MISSIRLASILCAACVLLAVSPAHADQCAVVTKKQAELVTFLLGEQANYALFCEPCGDKKPRVGFAQKIEARKVKNGYEVLLDGQPVDLAYLYMNGGSAGGATRPQQAVNVGLRVGCQVQGVSQAVDMGTPMWGNVVPNPNDPFVRIDEKVAISVTDSSAIDGTWTAETVVAASTCPGDKLGAKGPRMRKSTGHEFTRGLIT